MDKFTFHFVFMIIFNTLALAFGVLALFFLTISTFNLSDYKVSAELMLDGSLAFVLMIFSIVMGQRASKLSTRYKEEANA